MRTSLFIVVLAVLAFSSCDLATVNIATDFTKSITAVSDYPASEAVVSLKSAIVDPTYFESDTIDLTDNADLEEYKEKIKEVDVHTVSCTFSGIPTGDTIKSFTISVENTELSETLNNIAVNGTKEELSIATAILTAVGEELMDQEKIVINVSGTTSVPLTFTVEIAFDSEVKAGALSSNK